ncbi:MAG: carbon starvation protein A [Propionibacteriaceae bacterium]|nr:carbon starvation protein A [Propionibacteriaceae bacterium]
MSASSQADYLTTSKNHPAVAVVNRRPVSRKAKIGFGAIGLITATAWALIAFARGEHVNGAYFVIAAVGTYTIAFRFYAKLIEAKIVRPKNDRATPAELYENGRDFQPTDRRVLFGHHFAAIAGAGPLVGPVLATQMGYLPSVIWIIIGCVLAGSVQDYMVLWLSNRRKGRSLGQMIRDEMGTVGGLFGIIGILVIMIILIAVLGIVIIGALASSPWGVFSIACTIPIALFMGLYLRFIRPGKVGETSVIGVVLLLFAVVAGRWIAESPTLSDVFTLTPVQLAWALILYGAAAAILPVWLLLAPRDYLSTFMKVGTIAVLAVGVVIALPQVNAPALSMWGNGTATIPAPVFAGKLFPFLFITIACGALSGFHSLISSGTTPKLVEKETQMRVIGYGGMMIESFVAVMALVTAISLDQHLYFAMNAPAALTGGAADTAAQWVTSIGLGGTWDADPTGLAAYLDAAAKSVDETSIISRTGGAPTLAFGMAEILSFMGGDAMKGFWYHFAVMFEALFILTTIDAGTRVCRFMLSDALGNLPIRGMRRFKDPSWNIGAWLCTLLCVAGWGSILLMGVTDPLGGIYTLYPLFGISNQLLAAMALTLVTTVVIKKGYLKWAWIPAIGLLWDLVVTMTASVYKIFSGQQSIGYWAQHVCYVKTKAAALQGAGAEGLTVTQNAAGADVFAWQGEGMGACSVSGTMDNLNAVIRNTAIQEIMSVVFAVCVLVVFVVGVVVSVKAIRAGGLPVTEEPDQPSHYFAPAGLFSTKEEKALAAEWAAYKAAHGEGPETFEESLLELAEGIPDEMGPLE